jgi:hypothetical protein
MADLQPTSVPAQRLDLPLVRQWLAEALQTDIEWTGPVGHPDGLAVTYPTHLQQLRIQDRLPLPLVVLETTFCAFPRRRRDVLPLLAQANSQIERGRWFLQRDPPRLTYAMELPAPHLDRERLVREWQRFCNEAVVFGIELTLRTRAVTWLEVLRTGKGSAQPG